MTSTTDDRQSMITETLTDGVLRLTLQRPPVNALNREMFEQLRGAFERAGEDDEVRAVVLVSSNPRIFSAGADYKMLKDDVGKGYGGPGDFLKYARDTLRVVYECPVPVVVGVRGAAVGAGAVFPALADLVVAGPSTTFTLPELKVGVVGGAKLLARFMPPPMVRQVLLTGQPVTGENLHQVGALADFVADDEVNDVAEGIARKLAAEHPTAMRFAKQALVEVEDMGVLESYRVEQKYTVMLTGAIRDSLLAGKVG